MPFRHLITIHTLQLLGLNWSVTGTGHFQLPMGFQVESRDVETLHLGRGSFPRPLSPRDGHSETVIFKRCEQDKRRARAECCEVHTDGAAPNCQLAVWQNCWPWESQETSWRPRLQRCGYHIVCWDKDGWCHWDGNSLSPLNGHSCLCWECVQCIVVFLL